MYVFQVIPGSAEVSQHLHRDLANVDKRKLVFDSSIHYYFVIIDMSGFIYANKHCNTKYWHILT